TPVVVTPKFAPVAPAATVTLAGTVATVGLLLDNVTMAPPVGATAVKVTVPVLGAPPPTLVGLTVTEDRVGAAAAGLTVSATVRETAPRVPVIVSAVEAVTVGAADRAGGSDVRELSWPSTVRAGARVRGGRAGPVRVRRHRAARGRAVRGVDALRSRAPGPGDDVDVRRPQHDGAEDPESRRDRSLLPRGGMGKAAPAGGGRGDKSAAREPGRLARRAGLSRESVHRGGP